MQNTACSWVLRGVTEGLQEKRAAASPTLLRAWAESGAGLQQGPGHDQTQAAQTQREGRRSWLNPVCFYSVLPGRFEFSVIWAVKWSSLCSNRTWSVSVWKHFGQSQAGPLRNPNIGFTTDINSFMTRSMPLHTESLFNIHYWYFYLLHIFR